MREDWFLQKLHELGAIIKDDHLVYTSWSHGSAYIAKDTVTTRPRVAAAFCEPIAQHFCGQGIQYDAVVGPVQGGSTIAHWVAYFSYSKTPLGQDVLALYAEKTGDDFVLRRGYDKMVAGKKVLVVEDIINTGGSVKKVVQAVRDNNGEVVGVGALCNRGKVAAQDLGVSKLYALLDIDLSAWPESECPLCKADVPVNAEFGHGREFLALKALR